MVFKDEVMSTSTNEILENAIVAFLKGIPPKATYLAMLKRPESWGPPALEIPTPSELSLLHALEASFPKSRDELAGVAGKFTFGDAYIMWAFSVRMAIYAARTGKPEVFRIGSLGIVIDNDQIDSRDGSTALPILEDCAKRLNSDLASLMSDSLKLATQTRREIFEYYLTRPPEQRTLEASRIELLGTGDKLAYQMRSPNDYRRSGQE